MPMTIAIHDKRLTITTMTLFLSVLTCKPVAAGAEAAHVNPRAVVAASQLTPPGAIYEHKAIKIGGIDQWITIRGNKPENPILLFIHGGPGSPMMPESWTFQRPWEDYFTVVQWDQRGAGKTFSAAHRKVDKTLTIDRMQADAEELIDWLRHTYGKDKIFVMGHSWGSVLGLRIAQHRPEALFAYIGVGQVINLQRNEAVSYELTLARAEAVGNAEAVRQLKAMAPYPNPDGSLTVAQLKREREWVVALGGMR